jgi:hypothetical protein
MAGAKVFGIVTGAPAKPLVAWLEKPIPVTPALLAKTGDVDPQRVFRISAACQESACVHFDGTRCQLASRIVQLLSPVIDALPPCHLRSNCRWFTQEGRAACLRCPQVVTHDYAPAPGIAEAATPV